MAAKKSGVGIAATGKKTGVGTAAIEAPRRARARAGAKTTGGATVHEMSAAPAKAKTKAAAMPAGAIAKAGGKAKSGAKKVMPPKTANARGR